MYKQRNWQWIFLQNVTFFCKCNSVRVAVPDPDLEISGSGGRGLPRPLPWIRHWIGQNIKNEVSLERSIFADVVTYQFINLN